MCTVRSGCTETQHNNMISGAGPGGRFEHTTRFEVMVTVVAGYLFDVVTTVTVNMN